MIVNRRVLLTAAGVSCLISSPAQAAKTRKEVLAFYYGWYGTQAASGENAHWLNPDTAAQKIEDSVEYPAGGPYDSLSRVTISRQVRQAKDAGITGLIASWWGKGDRTDRQMPLLLSEAGKSGLKVTAYVEQAQSPESLARDLIHLYRSYSRRPNWLRVGARPVVFLFDRVLQTIGLDGWRRVRALVRKRIGDKWFVAGTANSAQEAAERKADFDALHIYSLQFELADDPAFGGLSPETWYRTFVTAQKGLKVRTATILPGFDDSHLPDREHPQTVGRDEGRLFNTLWQAASAARPDWILIVSFNEWHEGSQIEPSVEYGDRELRTSQAMAAAFMSGRTATGGAITEELETEGRGDDWLWWAIGGTASALGAVIVRMRMKARQRLVEVNPETPPRTQG